MDDWVQPAAGLDASGTDRAEEATPSAGRARWPWALRLLPAFSQVYWLCERSRLLEVRAFRRAYAAFYFHYKRYVEDPFQGLIESRPDLFRSGHIIDVGAHIGYTASLFMRAMSPGYHIFAIEPDTANVRGLRETVRRLRGEQRVVVIEAAAGNADGSVEFWHNSSHPGDNRVVSERFRARRGDLPTHAVSSRRVDSILAEHGADSVAVAFVKIDVQGCEIAVCEGLRGALDRSPRAAVAIEFAPSQIVEQGGAPEALLTFFWDRGYGLHLLTKNGDRVSLTREGLAATLDARGYADILCLPPGLD